MSTQRRSGRPARGGRRPYRLQKRAAQQQETRARITEALVVLHRTVGPARTTITDVAQRAGVQRMTVYNHFASEAEMFRACGQHWSSQHPLPDAEAWARITDPTERLRVALKELYRFYRGAEDMLGNVLRDAPLLPALAEVVDELWWSSIDAMVRALARGRALRGARRVRALAALRLAVDFATWRTLTESGLDDVAAAETAATAIEAVASRAAG